MVGYIYSFYPQRIGGCSGGLLQVLGLRKFLTLTLESGELPGKILFSRGRQTGL